MSQENTHTHSLTHNQQTHTHTYYGINGEDKYLPIPITFYHHNKLYQL